MTDPNEACRDALREALTFLCVEDPGEDEVGDAADRMRWWLKVCGYELTPTDRDGESR